MNIERFRTLLDAYGAEPARWPAQERAAAEAFARTAPETAALIAAARALDAALDRVAAAAPDLDPVAVAAAASAAAQRRPARRRGGAFGGGFAWPNVAGLAAAALVGFVIGWGDIVTLDGLVADDLPLSTTEEVLSW